ncbi:MAG: hypothetical protein Athens071425_239 [Parcubacteria group bacterium Athens0714_25]|nr:MAG: hypothetical protein Athens071425_239 [Parcubacteria group bacterium Athens0714_25]
MDQKTISKILQETEQGYDLISAKFSATRKNFWGSLEFIKEYAKNGNRVLDFGCGNGRLLELFGGKNIEYFGADVSEKLLEEGRKKYAGVFPNISFSKLDPLQTSLPFKSDYFNTVYSIAVFHHFPSKEYRLEMAKELHRVLQPGGYTIITVWNLWPTFASLWRGKQKKYYKNIFENWKNKISGKSDLDWNDCFVTFTDNQGKVFNRYHRAFTLRELKSLFSRVGFSVLEAKKVGHNLVVILEK